MATHTQEQSLKQNAYAYLKERLLNCDYRPGEYLNEKDLVQETKFGRTPIREAMILLQAEKLIQVIPRKGTYAQPITRDEVQEMYALRKIMEPEIIYKYLYNIDIQKLESFDAQLLSLASKPDTSTRQFIDMDIAFHRFIANASGSKRIVATIEPVFQESYRLSMYNSITGTINSPKETYNQHHRIVEAILSENRSKARDAMTFHLNVSLLATLASLDAVGKSKEQ